MCVGYLRNEPIFYLFVFFFLLRQPYQLCLTITLTGERLQTRRPLSSLGWATEITFSQPLTGESINCERIFLFMLLRNFFPKQK